MENQSYPKAAESKSEKDPFDWVGRTISEHSTEVFRTLYRESGPASIVVDSINQRRIRGGNGKTTVAEFTGSYRVGSEASPQNPFEFYTKVYKGINGNGPSKKAEIDYLKRPPRPWRFEYEAYKLLQGSGMVPQAYLFEIKGLRDKLVTLSAGDQKLEDKIMEINLRAGTKDSRTLARLQLPLFINVAVAEAYLDHYAQEEGIALRLLESQRVAMETRVTTEPKLIRKQTNYLRGWLAKEDASQLPPQLVDAFIRYSKPIRKILLENQNSVVHGATDGENIISVSGKEGWRPPEIMSHPADMGNIKFIDLESLKAGHPLIALSSTLTTPAGSYSGPEQWEAVIRRYNEARLGFQGIESGQTTTFFSGTREVPPRINEDRWRGLRSIFYIGAIHAPFKLGSKLLDMKSLLPESYRAMINELEQKGLSEDGLYFRLKKAMSRSIEHILLNTEDFMAKSKTNGKDCLHDYEIDDILKLQNLFRTLDLIA